MSSLYFIPPHIRYYYELGIEGFGEEVGWGEGFKLFFRLSIGGACIGVAFGAGLLIILFNLNRRLSGEDSVVQVVATITTAYLVFFTSEILAKCSGIIAVVFCGVTVKAFGETLYNDSHLSHHFWEITEYLLNTLLFALGGTHLHVLNHYFYPYLIFLTLSRPSAHPSTVGCVWGDILGASPIMFSGSDWVS